jgi:hypothetical protein
MDLSPLHPKGKNGSQRNTTLRISIFEITTIGLGGTEITVDGVIDVAAIVMNVAKSGLESTKGPHGKLLFQ